MNVRTSTRRGYMRPMQGWWRRDPFFVKYMVREATAVAVFIYAVVLMVGVLRLAQGEAAFNGWVAALRSPSGILLHLVLLVSMAVHAHSWFVIMPKTMPLIFVGGERLAASTIIRTGFIAAVIGNLVVLAVAWGLRP
jgi:fumarate reductase subunit C